MAKRSNDHDPLHGQMQISGDQWRNLGYPKHQSSMFYMEESRIDGLKQVIRGIGKKPLFVQDYRHQHEQEKNPMQHD